MATILKELVSLAKSANFGNKNTDGFENRVLKAVWSEGSSNKLVQLVSATTTYGGNILLPDGYSSDDAGLEKLRTDINAGLKDGSISVYGFVVDVRTLTEGEHTKVKNLANEHVIESFPRAWLADDRAACVAAVRRDLLKSIDKGKLEYVD